MVRDRLGLAGLLFIPFLVGGTKASLAQHPCAPPASDLNIGKDSGSIQYWFANNVPEALKPLFNEAAGRWNDPTCNVGGDDFPTIEQSPSYFATGGYESTLDAFRIKVHYVEAIYEIPTNGKCAAMSGSKLTLYEKTRSLANSPAVVCPAAKYLENPIEAWRDLTVMIMTHELGHALGAADSSTCSQDIMDGTLDLSRYSDDRNRVITTDTCHAVDTWNNTNEEFLAECVEPNCHEGPGDPALVRPNGPGLGPFDPGDTGGPGAEFDVHFIERHFVCTNAVVNGVYTELCFVLYT